MGCEETLFLPELSPDSGKRVGEGRMRLAIPGGGRDHLVSFGGEASGEQHHQQKQCAQARRGAGDSQARPLPPGLDPEVVADLAALRQAQE
ncbi:MAG: hypothetical protein ACREFA_07405 [Stellaceae bacterium]